jgi:hypothetical protein
VSLIPVINIPSRICPQIFEKNPNSPKGILMGPGHWFRVRLPLSVLGNKESGKILDLSKTGDKISFSCTYLWFDHPESSVGAIKFLIFCNLLHKKRRHGSTIFGAAYNPNGEYPAQSVLRIRDAGDKYSMVLYELDQPFRIHKFFKIRKGKCKNSAVPEGQ